MNNYLCIICDVKSEQISHHKSHLNTQKHKDKKEIFELKLSKYTNNELFEIYKTTDISYIIELNETKKLNLKYLNNITDDIMQMLEETNCISNKEALKEKIHTIHNYLRNNGAGYGMNALRVFNLLYGLKKIEENNLFDVSGFKNDKCKFSYLLKLANENKDEELAETILDSVLKSISKSKVRDLLLYPIPPTIKGNVFSYLIKEIESITLIEKKSNVLLSGKIYEYFIGRDESAISELGAYFTDRHIVDFIYEKLQPTISDDGKIYEMIDMFGGSGGFTTGYIDYLNKNYTNINWTTELKKVFHYDMNQDVIKSAGLEFFCLTGTLPDMKTNLHYKNSFTDEFVDDLSQNRKFHYVITNPPYGGDKDDKSETQIKRSKIKEYIKNELKTLKDEDKINVRQEQLKLIETQEKREKQEFQKQKVCLESCSNRIIKFAKKYNLKGNDKESCSLILLMDLVDINGTCCGVLKEGVFFNKTYASLRKCLIENFNVREIISVPSDQFENTSTKTSIIIFDNNGKTTQIKFSQLIVEKYTQDKFEEKGNYIVLVENKGDIKDVYDELVSIATFDEILTNSTVSLNGKDYIKKEIKVNEDYKLVPISDICKFIKGKQLSKDKFITGQYPVIGGGITPTGYHNNYNMEENTILCSSSGNNAGHISRYNSKVWASDCFAIIPNEKINKNYLFFILNILQNEIFHLQSGSAQPHVYSKDFEKHIKIPIPKSEERINYWVEKISKPFDEMNEKKKLLEQLENEVKNKIKEFIDNEECEEHKLGDICEIQSGKAIKSTERTGTLYPYYAANGISGYIDTYLYDGTYVICAQDGSIGATYLVSGKFYPSNHVWVLSSSKIKLAYIFYILKYIINYDSITTGSVIPKLTKEKISQIKIYIPKNEELIDNLQPLFNQIEEYQQDIKTNETLFKQYTHELYTEIYS
jgi:restriction endonuclease S subunit